MPKDVRSGESKGFPSCIGSLTCARREDRGFEVTLPSEGWDHPETDPTGEVTNPSGEYPPHLAAPLTRLYDPDRELLELLILSSTLGLTTLMSPLRELCTELCRLNLRISSPKSLPLWLISSALRSSFWTLRTHAPCNE
jgi:hypothetical protein